MKFLPIRCWVNEGLGSPETAFQWQNGDLKFPEKQIKENIDCFGNKINKYS